MAKTHYMAKLADCRGAGQTEYEYEHQTACGYVRDSVTRDGDKVSCKLCLRSEHMQHYHQINGAFADSSGCY